ncbi:MAG: DNA repair protein RadC [Lentisphaeria bacterium]|nr:DNA repair protein RadC [Lentisphaeria bacterium]
MIIRNEGHRERLRKRYLQAGEDGFPEYDLLELLLTYAVHRQDVKPLARELLTQFQDIAGIMDAGMEKLCGVKGIGENSALLFILIRDICSRYLESKAKQADVLSSPQAVQSFARMRLAAYPEEVMLVIYLDVKNQVINSEIISHGTIDTAVVFPRKIVEAALKNNAAGVIVVHNHPSGMTQPSLADQKFTRNLQDALATLEIKLLDHLIVSRTSTFSFVDHNMLERPLW